MNTTTIWRNLHKCGCFLLSFCLMFMILQIPVSAEQTESNTIRVGWYEDSYNITGENGERSGYGYEYQQTIAAYTGWYYEYVQAGWSDLLNMMENGEIDLCSGISYTDERAESMLFSEYPMGEEKYYLYADMINTDISPSNLETLNNKRVAVLNGSIQATQFFEWEEKHNLEMKYVFVNSFEQAKSMAMNHEIDCAVSSETPFWGEAGMSAIAVTGGSEIYFAINKNRPDIKRELDNSMRKIEYDKPFYTEELHKKYLTSSRVAVLSNEEAEWMTQHGTIRIGFLNNDAGVSVFDPDSDKMSGVITDYIVYASNCLVNYNLEFELLGFDSRAEQLQALKDDKIDMIFHVSQNPYEAEQNGCALSNTAWSFNMAALTVNDYFDENAENSIALLKDNFTLKWYISYNYPNWKIIEYDTMDEVCSAVQDKEADCFVVVAGQVDKYIENHKYNSVFLSKPGDASFAVTKGNTMLLSVLNKTLSAMPSSMLTGALAVYDSTRHKVTVADFIKDNFIVFTAVIIGVFLVIILLIMYFWTKTKQAARQTMELNGQLKESQSELQKALVQAQEANEAKTTFLNNMSHDIRTPINGIIGMLNIIRKSENDQERINDCLDKMDLSSKLLLSLVNDVLDMAKLERDAVILDDESINLDQVCNEVVAAVSFQAEAAGISVIGEHDDYTGVNVLSSSLHLKKILINLFTNSIKYNKPGGSIYTSMRTIAKTDDSITCQFSIKDTGIGMSEDFVANKLFTPFVQADKSSRSSYMGTGLGMSIVKQIVEKMGGTITVESKLGEGSCFTVTIPFKIDHQASGKKDDTQADITGLHLLVAEDNELNMEIAEFILTDNGAKIVRAKNGLEACEQFEASKAGEIDAILMDVMMPVMDGITATKRIRALDRPDAKTIPIIAMTANAFKEDEEKCLAAGMNAHIVKPLDIEKLKKVIRNQIDNHTIKSDNN